MQIRACAEKAGVLDAVFLRALAEPVHDFGLGHLAGNLQVAIEAVLGGDGREQVVDGTRTNCLEHGLAIRG